MLNNKCLAKTAIHSGNLDSRNGKDVLDLFTQLHKEGTSIVMVTHSQRDAAYASRIVDMLDGKILS